MSKGLIVSEKYGVNPTIPVCVWCGNEKNEIVLLGKLKGDVAAPASAVFDNEPCDKCEGHMSQGVTLIDVTEDAPHDNAIPFGAAASETPVYLTGKWCVVTDEAAHRIFDDSGWDESQRRICLEEGVLTTLVLTMLGAE